MTQATPLRSQSIPVTDPEAGLRMTEIFYSLQGEALTSGLPTVFVRLTGCPLRCVYCDTTYSFTGGERLSLEAIMADIAQYPCKRVCITGGEPLAQPNCIALINRLLEAGYEISLETAGALSVADVPEAVSKVMDVKTPSSGESDKNLWSNLDYLTQHDQLKFVIMNRSDYEWSKQQLIDYKLDQKVGTVWFSPMFNVHDSKDSAVEVPNLARELAEWILEDAIPVRLQLQLHKIIWADAKGK
jgi:7-carboxy-7-deazaguanine synthase